MRAMIAYSFVSSSLWSPHQSDWNTAGNPAIVGACRRQRPSAPLVPVFSCGSALATNHMQDAQRIPTERWAHGSTGGNIDSPIFSYPSPGTIPAPISTGVRVSGTNVRSSSPIARRYTSEVSRYAFSSAAAVRNARQ